MTNQELNCAFIEQLNKFSTVSFVPKGNSMYPFIKNKGQAVIISKKTKRLLPYDIGLYVRSNGTLVLHRVISVMEDGYRFCGDSQFTLETVAEDQVIGILTSFQKGDKTIEFCDKHREKAKKWYSKPIKRKIRLKFFFFFNKFKKINLNKRVR